MDIWIFNEFFIGKTAVYWEIVLIIIPRICNM